MSKNDFDEFQKQIQKMFGNNVKLQTPFGNNFQKTASEEPPPQPEEPVEDVFEKIRNFDLKPKDIRDELDKYVIKQSEAKKVLSVAVCDHYNHVRRCLEGKDKLGDEYAKQNIIVLGPTGVGKTYLLKCIARIIGVPFVKADATKFSETGYIGKDVEDMVRDLAKTADGNIDLAEFGIVYIDEVDKLANSGEGRGGKDVNGRGVQINLLKLMEEADVSLKSQADMMGQMEFMMNMMNDKSKKQKNSINTRHILFIVSGAFSKLAERIQRRLNGPQIGFMSEHQESDDINSYLSKVETADLVEYGFEPEFVGRLPVRVACESLNENDLEAILTNSKGSILTQYGEDFAGYDISFDITRGALKEIAHRASLEKTGARGLMTSLERVFRNFKFELPSTRINKFKVDEKTVQYPDEVLKELLESNKGLQKEQLVAEVESFAKAFQKDQGFTLHFDEGAIELLVESSLKTGKTIKIICEDKFKDYPYGLKLISEKGNIKDFTISREAVIDPDKELSKWVVEGFQNSSED
ncbi:MAG: AAA family ATPase [Lentisphaerales bacterium]|nr:AAA family ATPase [Lentisphaerales bacterium]